MIGGNHHAEGDGGQILMRPQFICQWTAQGLVAQIIWENETALGLKSLLRLISNFSDHVFRFTRQLVFSKRKEFIGWSAQL